MEFPKNSIFGSEDAEIDDLLEECQVDLFYNKPIIVGKWGVGKTALIKIRNLKLDKKLKSLNISESEIWYMREESLDISEILNLRRKFTKDSKEFIKFLELNWKNEINRRIALLLSALYETYERPKGRHWEEVLKYSDQNQLRNSLLKLLPEIATLITGDSSRGDSVQKIQDHFDNKALEKNIQKCLLDISENEYFPAVAVEPIDSPNSEIEEQSDLGLAEPLVISLLNAYKKWFRPNRNQLVKIYISIPWHRFNKELLDFPQKYSEYVDKIEWSEDDLYLFINKRIAWEFCRVKRTIKHSDFWKNLFQIKIKNPDFEDLKEDSFQYILRHTLHHPRELQRLSRKIVEKYAKKKRCSNDEILIGKKFGQIDGQTIIEVINEVSTEIMDEVILEGERRYLNLIDILDKLRGLTVPFTSENIERRLRNTSIDLIYALTVLWDCGIIGVQYYCQNIQDTKKIKKIFGSNGNRYYNVKGKNHFVWTIFNYNNMNNDLQYLAELFKEEKNIDVKLILHPITRNYLFTRIDSEFPIGF